MEVGVAEDRISDVDRPTSFGARSMLGLSRLLREAKGVIEGATPIATRSMKGKDGKGMTGADLLLGSAPEALEDWAYGVGKSREGEEPVRSSRGRGQTFQWEDPRVIDVATLPTIPGISSLKGALRGLKAGTTPAESFLSKIPEQSALANVVSKGVEPAVDMSRREFLKKGGAVTAAASMGGVLPKVAEKLLAKGGVEVVVAGVKAVAKSVGAKGLAGNQTWSDVLSKMTPDQWDDMVKSHPDDEGYLRDMLSSWSKKHSPEATLMDESWDVKPETYTRLEKEYGDQPWVKNRAPDERAPDMQEIADAKFNDMASLEWDISTKKVPPTPDELVRLKQLRSEYNALRDRVNELEGREFDYPIHDDEIARGNLGEQSELARRIVK
jgi:hypothetical protein